MKRLLALLALLVPAPAFAADPPKAGTPVAGVGVASADQKTLFLPGKDGVEAVEIDTGKPLWTNKDATKLAGASDKLVFAWAADPKKATEFRVVAMDTATGKTVGKSDPIAMPEWASSTPTYGRSFRTAAKADGDAVVVAWEARAFYAGGAAPTPEIIKASMKDASGLVKFDPTTGKLTRADGKPKDADFAAGPAGGGGVKVGDYEFRSEEMLPGFKPGQPMVTTVKFSAVKGGKVVWTRELAGNPFLPSPP